MSVEQPVLGGERLSVPGGSREMGVHAVALSREVENVYFSSE